MSFRCSTALIFLGFALHGVAQTPRAEPLPPLLKRVMEASMHIRYSGERIVEFRQGPDRKRLIEYVIKDGPRTRIEFPSDSPYRGQIIVETGSERRHFFPDKNEVHVLPARGEEALQRLRKFLDQRRGPKLTVRIVPSDPVAGHATQSVSFVDSRGNVVQRLWVEPKTALVLKREFYDPVGSRMGSFEFSKLDLNPRISKRDFIIERKGARIITPLMQAKTLAQGMGLQPAILPNSSGFKLESARTMTPKGTTVLALGYTSDEGRITLFQLKEPLSEDRLRHFARGRLSTYSWSRNGEHFAIVGELNEGRLREIARMLGDS